jgi:hypothetical protein
MKSLDPYAMTLPAYLEGRRLTNDRTGDRVADALHEVPDCRTWDEFRGYLQDCGCNKAEVIVGHVIWRRYLRALREASR